MPSKRSAAIPLVKDQLWKFNDTYIQIAEIGKVLIHYRMFKGQMAKTIPRKMTSIHRLQVYLKSNRAVLVKKPK